MDEFYSNANYLKPEKTEHSGVALDSASVETEAHSSEDACPGRPATDPPGSQSQPISWRRPLSHGAPDGSTRGPSFELRALILFPTVIPWRDLELSRPLVSVSRVCEALRVTKEGLIL